MREAVLLVALVLGLGIAGTAGGGADTSTAIVDRTVSCPLKTSQGFRLLGIAGGQGFVGYPSSASAQVTDELAAGASDALLVYADSRGIRLHRSCAAAKRVVLTRTGLPGPPDRFEARYDCESRPTRVLVRVRAIVASATPWKRSPPMHLQLERTVSKAEVAVQTPSRKPIAFMTIAGDAVRGWISPTCVRD